jgi:hypothetical protein
MNLLGIDSPESEAERMRKNLMEAGVTDEDFAAAEDSKASGGLMSPGMQAPTTWREKAIEEDGGLKYFGKNMLDMVTGGWLRQSIFPESVGAAAQYKSDLALHNKDKERQAAMGISQRYESMLDNDDPSDDLNALRMGAVYQPDVYEPVLRDRLQQKFNPDPATYTEGKWQFDPNHNNGEGENKGAWYLERQASDGTTKKDYAAPNFRPQVAMPNADYIDKEVGAAQEKLFGHQGNAQGARNVLGQMEQIGEDNWTSGIQGKAGEAWKYFTGSEDYLTSVRKNYSDIKVRNVVNNLPPGVASDKDIDMVMEPWPEGTSDYGFIKRKLEAIARLEEGRAAYRAFEADYISKNRRRDGLARAWDDTDHAKKIAGDNVPAPTMKWERLPDVK